MQKSSLKLEYGAQNPHLRMVCKPITTITKQIKHLAHQMSELMADYDGVWLAAPQVWYDMRLIITTQWKVRSDWELDCIKELVMINPIITSKSQSLWSSAEGCLSLPGIEDEVLRHKEIKIEYLDLNGQKRREKLTDFNAAIVQHEIDHLDWVLFVDRIK